MRDFKAIGDGTTKWILGTTVALIGLLILFKWWQPSVELTVQIVVAISALLSAFFAGRSSRTAHQALQKENKELQDIIKLMNRPNIPIFRLKVLEYGEKIVLQLSNVGQHAQINWSQSRVKHPHDEPTDQPHGEVPFGESITVTIHATDIKEFPNEYKPVVYQLSFKVLGQNQGYDQSFHIYSKNIYSAAVPQAWPKLGDTLM